MDSLLRRLRSQVRLSTLSGLQLFQFSRYASFALIGISFAKLGISKTEIGQFESFIWLTGLFSFFWITGTMSSVLAVYPRETESGQRKLLFTTFCMVLTMGLIAGFAQLFIRGGSALGLAYILLNNASFLVEYILFLRDRRRGLIVYAIVMAITQYLLCVVPAYISGDTYYSMYGLLIVAAIKFIYIAYLLQRHVLTTGPSLKENGEISGFNYMGLAVRLRSLFLLSLPLMLSFLVNGSADYIDGYVVRHFFTLADFSVFRYGSREFPLFTTLAATLSMSIIPRVALDLDTGLDHLRRESARYMHFFFPLAIILILLNQWLFTTFFSPQFAISGRVFAALMLLTVPRLLFPQTILMGLKENRLILASAIIEMFINLVASIILVRGYGLVGVAYGTVIAYISEKLIMAAFLYYRHGISPARYVAFVPFTVYSALTVVSYIGSLMF